MVFNVDTMHFAVKHYHYAPLCLHLGETDQDVGQPLARAVAGEVVEDPPPLVPLGVGQVGPLPQDVQHAAVHGGAPVGRGYTFLLRVVHHTGG